MERISIFNYEVFYLDFLEGNLNEEDTSLLMAFFEENPDLKMEDQLLPTLSESEAVLSSDYKRELKQPLLTDTISRDNVEYFLISKNEGLLSLSKENELKDFVEMNAEFKSDNKIFSAVYFKPDLSVIYDEKEGLKRKRAIILWPYAASIAAAVIIAFFLVMSAINSSSVSEQVSPNIISQQKPQESSIVKNTQKEKSDDDLIEKRNQNSIDKQSFEANQLTSSSNDKKIKTHDKNDTLIESIEKRPVNNILTAFDNQELEPISNKTFNATPKVSDDRDYAAVHFSDMENPIKPITNFIGETAKKEVDFRAAKKTNSKPGGFYLKVGKFELSRKKH